MIQLDSKNTLGNKLKSNIVTKTQIKLESSQVVTKPIEFMLNFINPIKAIQTTGIILYGSREEKAKLASSIIPATVKTTKKIELPRLIVKPKTKIQKMMKSAFMSTHTKTAVQPFYKKIEETIIEQKEESSEIKQFWEEKTLAGTDIKIPDIKIPDIFGGLKDIGKYILIGGIVILAIILLRRK